MITPVSPPKYLGLPWLLPTLTSWLCNPLVPVHCQPQAESGSCLPNRAWHNAAGLLEVCFRVYCRCISICGLPRTVTSLVFGGAQCPPQYVSPGMRTNYKHTAPPDDPPTRSMKQQDADTTGAADGTRLPTIMMPVRPASHFASQIRT